MQRLILGFLALAFLISGGIVFALPGHDPQWEGPAAMLVRIGLMLVAIWLALPALARVQSWRPLLYLVGLLLLVLALPTPLRWGLLIMTPLLLVIFWPQIREIRRAYREGASSSSSNRSR